MRRRWFALSTIVFGVALPSGCVSPHRVGLDGPVPSITDTSWLTDAQRHLAEREYRASENGKGLQAPNRAHNLRTYFEKTGIRVHDRTAGGQPQLVELSLAAVGREGELLPVPPGQEVLPRENRVDIQRPGFIEWYVNSPAGLEQGFTIAERPAGDAPLVLELAVLGARASLRGDAVAIATVAGRRLAYGALAVADVHGQPVAAHLEVPAPDRIQLVVVDADAIYPITVDPLLSGASDSQLESDQGAANAGYAVSTAGDVNADGYADVLVGASAYDDGQTDEGAVFLFLGGPNGIADAGPAGANAVLTGQQDGGYFGYSVAAAGDVDGDGYGDVIVGMRYFDNGQTDEGGAFVFIGGASGLVGTDPASAATQLESNQALAEFGFSVAGAGDVNGDGYADVIVGAHLYDNGQTDEGAAWVFHGSASGIANGSPSTASTQIEANQASAVLGSSVASAGDVNADGYDDIIVGAPLYDITFADAGVASIFLGSASGVANGSPSTAHGNINGDQAGAQMGFAVTSAGDITGDGYSDVMASASRFDDGETDEGIVSILFGSAAGIPGDYTPSTASDRIESNQANAYMGERIGRLGDVNGDGYADVAVGAHLYDDGETDEGCLWVFFGGADGITASPSPETPSTSDIGFCSNQAGAEFGANVTGAGDVNGDGFADLLAGADMYDAGATDEGAAFVYLGGAKGIVDADPTSAARLESNQDNADLGVSVASAGDVNGDGYGDVIVGAPYYDAGEVDEGAAFVFLGGASGIANGNPSTAATVLQSNQAIALLGWSVASAGDVNGDGYGDVVVGAPDYDAGEADEGAAFVFLGRASGIANGNPSTAAAALQSDQASAVFGYSVASAGDVNGDGYGDVIVGAHGYDAGEGEEGAAFVFLGGGSGIANGNPSTAAATLQSNQAAAGLGLSVASAGDVNGDGFGDVIVGAFRYDAGEVNEGAAFVFSGGASGIANGDPSTAAAVLQSNQGNAQLGYSVASAGDVNGDGYGDVIVGAAFYDEGEGDEGAAFVFTGGASGITDGDPSTAAAAFQSDWTSALLGYSVASAGDVNGDGYGDVIVGARLYKAGEGEEGAAFVFPGGASGIANGNPATAAAVLQSNQVNAQLGYSVASAGDVNGDGYGDVIAGAWGYDGGSANEGAAFVFVGNGNSRGRLVLTRQRTGYGYGTPVQPWGISWAWPSTAFIAELRADHPEGTGRVKAEIEACPAGLPYGDAGCTTQTSASWLLVNGGAPFTTISHSFSGLPTSVLYHWRARILRAPATGSPPANPAHGPWRQLDAQSRAADVRLPEPGLLLSLASGIALVATLARGRARVRTGSKTRDWPATTSPLGLVRSWRAGRFGSAPKNGI